MKPKQREFLTLRADGLSYDKIAKKLKVHKTTLIEWSKTFSNEIKDLQFLNLQQLKEEYKHTTIERYRQLLKHLNKVDEAIEALDLNTANIKDLILARNDLLEKINKIEAKAEHSTQLTEPLYTNFEDDNIPIKARLNEL